MDEHKPEHYLKGWLQGYSGSTVVVNDWYTQAQAVSDGLEDLFTQDLNGDGLVSGGASFQIFGGSNTKLQLKNIKGTTLGYGNTPQYNAIAAKKQSDNSFEVLFEEQYLYLQR